MGRANDAGFTQECFERQVARLAASRHGIFSRAQVMNLGATKDVIRRRLAAGRWERLASDVFRLAGTPPSERQTLLVACLAWGDEAAASHRSAAPIWCLGGFQWGPVELTVPRARRRSCPGIVHRNLLPPVDVTVVDAIPVTTPTRTLIDLASVAPSDSVEEALDDALRRGIVSIARLRWRLGELARPGRPGIAAMRRLLDDRAPASPVPESAFERRLLRELRRAGLPDPVLQHEIRSRGRLVAVVDFAFPDARLAIEADGYRWHSGRTRWDQDRTRRNRLTLLGWRIIHVTWTELTRRPDAIVEAIASALATSG